MNALDARDLGLLYGSTPVLHGISLALQPGERLGIVGRSGSGKTALARLLAALPPPAAAASGTLAWPGGALDLAALTPALRRRQLGARIGWLPQEAHAALHGQLRLGRQLAETLRAAGRPSGPRDLEAAIAGLGLDPALLHRYPHQVSGGQAQRLALACVFAQSPAVLVADEPTSALDVGTAAAILDLLVGSRRLPDLALVLVTHDMRAASRCDRVLVLDQGRVVEAGEAAALLARPTSEAAIRLVRAAATLAGRC